MQIGIKRFVESGILTTYPGGKVCRPLELSGLVNPAGKSLSRIEGERL